MLSKNFFIFILISIIFFIKCDDKSDTLEDNYDEGNHQFKDSLKKYLIETKLFDSEKPIEKKEMKKILIDALTEKDAEFIPEFLKAILEKLSTYFIDKYYKKKKIIRGKDLYDLIDIGPISEKFQQITGNYDYDFDALEIDENESEESDENKSSPDL